MRAIFWGTFDTSKPRTRILLRGLRAAGVDITEIHARVWEGIEDKSQLTGWHKKTAVLVRWVLSYPGLLWRLARAPRPDVLLVGYPGILDILLAVPIARIRGIPVAWDVFLSMYDTICMDRQLIRHDGIAGRLVYQLERFALRRADVLFMDTCAHARRLEMLFGLEPESCGAVWVGAELERFPPQPLPPPARPDTPTRVLFYGQFIPLHGVGTIVEAARLLREESVQWQLVGRGQEAPRIRQLLSAIALPKVEWTEWIDYAQLQNAICRADLCLGIFGQSEKAASVIPNKVFQIVASQRPLVTRDSPAIRELVVPSPPGVWLVPPDDPQALADAIMTYRRIMLGGGSPSFCHRDIQDRIGPAAIGRQFLDMIDRRLKTH